MLVVVVGSVNADLVVAVEALPAAGETVAGGRFARWGGGKGANQAVAAARLGAEVAFVGAVGRDEFGDDALRQLEAEGIDVSAVARVDAPTGVALIVVDAAGENQIAVASGANAEVTRAIVGAALERLLATRTGVVLLGHEIPAEAVAAGAEAAAAAGWRVILNPAPARALDDRVLAARPILTPNASEAARLTGEDDPERAARALRERTGAPVLVTLGAAGALLLDGDAAVRIPAPAVRVVDTTGAGDTVNGALAAELAAGRPLEDAVRFALAAAALSTQAGGAREGMPRREDIAREPAGGA
ncbi:ribokinase [Candidatus Solirubrobacter pratensis]|uniref:ribokinase n=1 Tax=Candidatus Solirubrobacter pratensis TaxID=1298857 RepID=UPI0004126748|nr:ribokinase [Candidatus Solirubrobacter pratensis]